MYNCTCVNLQVYIALTACNKVYGSDAQPIQPTLKQLHAMRDALRAIVDGHFQAVSGEQRGKRSDAVTDIVTVDRRPTMRSSSKGTMRRGKFGSA